MGHANGWPSFDGDGTHRIALELTVRGTVPLDDLACEVEQHVAALEELAHDNTQCFVNLNPIWRHRHREFEVQIRWIGLREYVEVRQIGLDLLRTIRVAFESLRGELECSQSGVIRRPAVEAPEPEEKASA